MKIDSSTQLLMLVVAAAVLYMLFSDGCVKGGASIGSSTGCRSEGTPYLQFDPERKKKPCCPGLEEVFTPGVMSSGLYRCLRP